MTVGGNLIAMPFRHASSGLHYNEEILAERGFKGPPATIEELADMARACTYRRADATACVGLCMPGVTYPNVIDLAWAWMQTGRAAMSLQSMGRNRIYNDPAKSKFAGKIRTVALPASRTMAAKFKVAPAKVEFWGMAIPRNARRKDLSWAFIREMVSKQATLTAALNGNGPVRRSAYYNADFTRQVAYADEERRVLEVARIPLPAFDDAARAADVFKEEAEAAVLGMKSPEEAMRAVVARVTPMLPK